MNALFVSIHVYILVSSGLARECPKICKCSFPLEEQHSKATNITILPQASHFECTLTSNFSLSTLLGSMDRNLTHLTLWHSLLRSFNAICRFANLVHLDLSWNDFERILSYDSYVVCSRLTTLKIAHNHIKNIRRNEFASFPGLEVLDLSYNEITEIREDSLHLPMLRELNLRHNKLSSLPGRIFRFVANLASVDLSMNRFRSIDLSSFCYLRFINTLNLSSNGLMLVRAKTFDGNVPLDVLDLSNNHLSELPSSRILKALDTLIFDHNELEVLKPLHDFYDLRKLSMSNMPNFKMVLSRSFWSLPNLLILEMYNNTKMGYFAPDAFLPSSQIHRINLQFSGLRVIDEAVIALPNLTQLLLKGNNIDFSCLKSSSDKWHKIRDLKLSKLKRRSANCHNGMFPIETKSKVDAKIGAPIRIYCCSLIKDEAISINWTIPAPDWSNRFIQTPEYLEIKYTEENDTGAYICRKTENGRVTDHRVITLSLQIPVINISFRKITHYYITVGWNHSAAVADKYGFYLKIQRTNGGHTWVRSPALAELSTLYSFVNLAPRTNYTICICYQPQDKIFYEQCLDTETSDVIFSHIGLTLNYTLIALISGIIVTCCGFGWIRCVYHRFHVWQREKLQSRMQESISAQGFFSSFDSLSSANVAVTYENPHRLETAESPEEAVRLVKHSAQLHSAPNCTTESNGSDDVRRTPSAMTM